MVLLNVVLTKGDSSVFFLLSISPAGDIVIKGAELHEEDDALERAEIKHCRSILLLVTCQSYCQLIMIKTCCWDNSLVGWAVMLQPRLLVIASMGGIQSHHTVKDCMTKYGSQHVAQPGRGDSPDHVIKVADLSINQQHLYSHFISLYSPSSTLLFTRSQPAGTLRLR
jgi:hypothetical protein